MKPKRIYLIIQEEKKMPVTNLKKVFDYATRTGAGEVVAHTGAKKIVIRNYTALHRNFVSGISLLCSGVQFTVEETRLM